MCFSVPDILEYLSHSDHRWPCPYLIYFHFFYVAIEKSMPNQKKRYEEEVAKALTEQVREQ